MEDIMKHLAIAMMIFICLPLVAQRINPPKASTSAAGARTATAREMIAAVRKMLSTRQEDGSLYNYQRYFAQTSQSQLKDEKVPRYTEF